ncbi:alpha/beta hydrolase fold domain-containing protein [Streptomyces sp. NPDC004533]|uniref:alpha/beta hydrolase fold domain-containing protein n=1 Tax=Streptomyces sp. NPDC004533 TaxID=3154278 RepID=UPI0033BDCB55
MAADTTARWFACPFLPSRAFPRSAGLVGRGRWDARRIPPLQEKGLPRALVITDEADVLRDEGEAYAAKLRAAGNDVTAVRYEGTIHDFAMLNALAKTNAAQAPVEQAGGFLRTVLHSGS